MMRIATLLIVFLLSSGCLAVAQNTINPDGKIEHKHDEFKGVSTVWAKDIELKDASTLLTNGLTLDAFLITKISNAPVKPEVIFLMIKTTSRDWQYLECHSLDFLADGDPIHADKVTHDGSVGRGYVLEFISANIKPGNLLKIANSQVVRGRLCNTEFALTPAQISKFRELAVEGTLMTSPAP